MTPWPADKVERWPISKLVPYARNARTHSDSQIASIAASIKEWGWTIPVLVDEGGGLIAGHGRVLAARQLGIEDVPVMTAVGWSESKKRAYCLADNKLTLNADWDTELLALEIAELRDDGFDLSLTGFGADEIAALMAPVGDSGHGGAGSLAGQFMIAPFSVLNAREGWWQARKLAWLALGIQSELGRGENSGNKLAMSETIQRLKPSADQAAKHQRANGKGNTFVGANTPSKGKALADGLIALRTDQKAARKATAEPGGSKMPAADYGKSHARGDGRGRPIDPQG